MTDPIKAFEHALACAKAAHGATTILDQTQLIDEIIRTSTDALNAHYASAHGAPWAAPDTLREIGRARG